MALPKLFNRIFWHNNTTPAINEDNLNAMSKALDDIDDRVIMLGGDVIEYIPQIQHYLEQAEDLVEAMENLSKNPPYIGQNGNWFVWDTESDQYIDSGVDASITVSIADITMLEPSATPYVTNTGTNTDPIFHLFIPRAAGISSITKTSTAGLVDTYTITFDNGNTTTFRVTNGADGVSPEVTISSITGGHAVTITDADHPSGQSFNVMDGESPGVTITNITGGHRVTITDADHPSGQSFDVMDGEGSGDMLASVYDAQSAVATAGGITSYVAGKILSDTVSSVSVGTYGTASGTGVRYSAVNYVKNGSTVASSNKIPGTTYMQKDITLSTTNEVTVTFTNTNITTSSVIDVYTSDPVLMYKTMSISSGSCSVTFDKQESASTITVRIYIK